MPVVAIYTMNDFTRVCACNTYQVKNYDRYVFAPNQAEVKQAWKDAHWEEDLQKAYDAGKRMAEKIMK